jgi:hypothetical protein
MLELEQTSQALTGADFTRRLADPVRWRWRQNRIGFALMVPFAVKTQWQISVRVLIILHP